MSNAPSDAPKKKGKLKGLIMGLLAVIVLVGGGVGAGLYAAGAGLVGGAHKQEVKEDPNAPKLVPKDEHGESADAHDEKPALPMGLESEQSPDPSKYKASYYSFEQPFTANLRDSDSFAQIGLAAATFYDAKVIDNIKNNEMPIRSAVLMTISSQDSFAIATPEGKLKLQKELKDSINAVLRSREGFGGVDNVYFTSMIIQ